MRNIIIILFSLFSAILMAQNKTFEIQVLDSKTGKPIENAYLSVNFKSVSGLTDVNGVVKLKTSPIDTVEISKVGYKFDKFLPSDKLTINLDPGIMPLGTLKFSDFNDLLNAECSSKLKSIPKAKFNGLIGSSPKYHGGLLCFDKYVYIELTNIKLDKAKIKTIIVTFILTEEGIVKDVQFIKELPKEVQLEVERIFLNSSQWIPARQMDKYYPVKCKYKIKF